MAAARTVVGSALFKPNTLKPSGHYNTYVSPSLTFSISTFCPHSVFMCFVWISEQTAIISLYNINWQIFITETECVYCAVRTGPLYTTQIHLSFYRLIQQLFPPTRSFSYSFNSIIHCCFVFICKILILRNILLCIGTERCNISAAVYSMKLVLPSFGIE